MEETAKKRTRKNDDQLLAEYEKKVEAIKNRIAAKKQIKDYEPICTNLGKILLELSGYDLSGLPSEKRVSCKKNSPTAKKIVKEMARLIAAGEAKDE